MLDLPSHQKRTRSQFERQIQRLEQDTLRMGALVETSCWLSHAALFERNLEAATSLSDHDQKIDRLYRQIELDCINLIALQSPVARDLRLLSAMMQLIRDLERIGDYAKNLGDIAVKLFTYRSVNHLDKLEMMSNRCRAMLAMSLEALSALDAEIGAEINIKDDAVDQDYTTLYNLLKATPVSVGGTEQLMLMVLAIHHLERMADHAANIGQRVAFIVTGKRA